MPHAVRPGRLGLIIAAVLLLVPPAARPPCSTPQTPSGPAALPPSAVLDRQERGEERGAWELRRLRDPRTGRLPTGIHRREQERAATLPRRAPGRGLGGAPARDKAAAWTKRGPHNYGGRTRALAVDVTDPSGLTLLAGGVSGGMWRSVDGGETWTLTTGSSQLHSVTCLVQDVRLGHEATWWYGTGEVIAGSPEQGGDAYRGDGIYRSDDGGRSWTVLPGTASGTPQAADQPFDGVSALALDATRSDGAVLYAATLGGILRSADGGGSWSVVLGGGRQAALCAEVAVGPAGTVYATLSSDGAVRGIFRSQDGLAWTDISPAALEFPFHRIAIGVAPSAPGLVYFLTSDRVDKFRHQFFMHFHTAGGADEYWYDRSAALDALPDPWGEAGNTYSLNTQRGYNLHVTVDPLSAARIYVGGVHLWRSDDAFAGGAVAQRVGGYYYPRDDEHHADQHRLVFVGGSSHVALTASDGGVHRTEDLLARTVTWESLNRGYDTTQFYTVAVDRKAAGDPVIVGGAQDHGTFWTGTTAGDAPWRLVLGGDGSHCAVIDALGGDYVLSTYKGWIFRVQLAADGTPLRVMEIDPYDLPDAARSFINPFLIPDQDEPVIYLASRQGVWRNLDYARSPWDAPWDRNLGWDQLTVGTDGEAITALAAGGDADHDLYFGTDEGGVYLVRDAKAGRGRLPERLDGGVLAPAGSLVSAIAVHPRDRRKVLVAYGNYNVPSLWYSEDAGATWRDVEGALAGPDGPSVRCLAIVADGDRDLWLCGTSVGLFSAAGSADAEVDWVLEAPEIIGNVIVDALAVRPADRLVVAATHGRGIFSAALPPDWSVERVPGAVRIAGSAPNPFNAGTTIAFDLPAAAQVRLEVLDLRGRRVAVLVDGRRDAGEHAVPWDGTDAAGRPVPSGVYRTRLSALGVVSEGRLACVR